jgi:hypothetical protein
MAQGKRYFPAGMVFHYLNRLKTRDLTPLGFEEIETQALIRGGAKADEAVAAVRQAIQALKDAGVTRPIRIPWGG